jgi:fatty acyl-CoA reductase
MTRRAHVVVTGATGFVGKVVLQHLVRNDPSQASFAGAAHDDARSALAWARDPARDGNATMRLLGLGLRAALRRGASDVTFDRPAFESALAKVPADAVIVLAPSHRSYLDFLVASYLCFQHPELGIPVPHIAAAEEFGKIPLVGHVLRRARAFYIKRGVGCETPELSDELRRLSARAASLMFFVEGQRSRSRLMLPPKRGLLRGLQATGQTFALLPIAMSYDRLPEEHALERELAGHDRSQMRLGALLAWLGQLARGRVSLGRIHVGCGDLVVLDPSSDVRDVSRTLVAAHQRHTTISSFHLRAFLSEARFAGDLDEAWLAAAVRERGGRVLASRLEVPALSPVLAQSLRNQWMHWFYGDALARYPDSIAVRDHVARHAWTPPRTPAGCDARTAAAVDALMAPILDAYRITATRIGAPDGAAPLAYERPADLVKAYPIHHLPHVEDAYRALADREVVRASERGYRWSTNARAAMVLARDPGDPRSRRSP